MRQQPQSFTGLSASARSDTRGSAARIVLAFIRAYQVVLRPVLPPVCRFAPSCSEYAHQAIGTHGVWRGGVMAVRRIGRCHPWHAGGYDPVPGAEA
jgi:putative membrane protein insertion efficiency factor